MRTLSEEHWAVAVAGDVCSRDRARRDAEPGDAAGRPKRERGQKAETRRPGGPDMRKGGRESGEPGEPESPKSREQGQGPRRSGKRVPSETALGGPERK